MVHRRQFLISATPVEQEGFDRLPLAHGRVLSWHRDLPVFSTPIGGGETAVLLGWAYQIDEGKPTPAEQLRAPRMTRAQVADMTASWNGRWALLYGDDLHLDVCGTLGVYYSAQPGREALSGSCALLSEVMGFERNPEAPPLRHHMGINWYPGPATPLNGVRKLLASEGLTFGDKVEVWNRRAIDPAPYRALPAGEKIDQVIAQLERLYRAYAADGYNLLLPLSAGRDSRTLLGPLLKSGVPFTAYTCIHPDMSYADSHLPMKMAKQIGFRHMVKRRTGQPDEDKRAEYDRHTFGCAGDIDREYYAYSQYPAVEHGMLLRGGLWESTAVYYKTVKNADSTDSGERLNAIRARFPGSEKQPFMIGALAEWLKHVEECGLELNWREQLYYEQRDGCWLSALEQGMDMIDLIHIHPVNAAKTMSMLISIDFDARLAGWHQAEIMRRSAPKLMQYPINKVYAFEKMGLVARYVKRWGARAAVKRVTTTLTRRFRRPAGGAKAKA